MPTPYLTGRLNAVARRGNVNVQAWFNVWRESDRSWEVDESSWLFRAHYVPQKRLFNTTIFDPAPMLRQNRPDIFLSLYHDATFMRGTMIAKSMGIRTAFRSLPTFDSWFKRSRYKQLLKQFLFRSVDAVKTSGKAGTAFAHELGTPLDRIFVVKQTVDVEHFGKALLVSRETRMSRRRELGLDGCVFICVSRLIPEKGIDHLLNAFRDVRARGENASLLILGSGSHERQYREMAKDIPGVVFGGFVLQKDLPSYYALADAFVFPTLGDPNGVVVEEAMSAGLPVVSTLAAGDIELRVPDGLLGYLVPPADPVLLADRMFLMASDSVTRSRMAQACLESAQAFGHDAYARDFERMVEQILHLPHQSGAAAAAARFLPAAIPV